MGASRLRQLARRASRRRRRGPTAFAALARDVGVPLRRLRLLADAWDEGGMAGVDALGPATDDAADADEAPRALEAWRQRHFPLEVLRCEVWRNRVTVWRLLPPADRTGTAERVPLLQLRVTGGDRWHLYRKAAHGEWWPVTVHGRGRAQTLADCLEAARVDAGNRFWSLPGPRPSRGPDLRE